MTGRSLGLVYSVACGILAAACLWFAFGEWQTWRGIAISQVVVLLVVSAFLLITSFSVARRWRLGAGLAAVSGVVLILYAAVVVVLGWEDVGGAAGAIPLALGAGVVGTLGIVVGVGKSLKRGEVA